MIRPWETLEAPGLFILHHYPLKQLKYKVIVDELNIRQGPGTSYPVKGVVHKGEAYTITQLSGSWGKLKSGAGWINVNAKYCTKVK